MIDSKRFSLRSKLTLSMWAVMFLLAVLPVYLIFSSLEGEVRKEAAYRSEGICDALVLALKADWPWEGWSGLQEFA
ncbi:MAG: hypothetical protein ACLFMP_06985, partial [Desulfonatronovibrionaceae bacterium]